MRKITKALIPVAGLGTRFLPATKTIPKEMLPIVDAPTILYVVEEAVSAGICDIVFIAGRGKSAIEDFFDVSHELESKLIEKNQESLLKRVVEVREKINIISVRQKEAKGLGHAVLCGQSVIGNEPFAVLLGDEIMCPLGHQETQAATVKTVTQQLCETLYETNLSTVAVIQVPRDQLGRYGVVTPQDGSDKNPFKVIDIVEKPSPDKAQSDKVLPGRYVFDPCVFNYLKKTSIGVGGEIQLTDAMVQVAQKEGLLARLFTSQRYDTGDKLGYLKANIELALKKDSLEKPLKQYLKELVNQW